MGLLKPHGSSTSDKISCDNWQQKLQLVYLFSHYHFKRFRNSYNTHPLLIVVPLQKTENEAKKNNKKATTTELVAALVDGERLFGKRGD